MNLLGMDFQDMVNFLQTSYGKGNFHAAGLMTHLYKSGSLAGLEKEEHFVANPSLAKALQQHFYLSFPQEKESLSQGDTQKFSLILEDGRNVESVYIPMENHGTLCVSSQVGCKRGCAFCRTARMGLQRNLLPEEIVAQYMHCRFKLGRNPRNLVFMGMGEPLDNADAVFKAIDILTHPKGAGLLHRSISISTCGQVDGLRYLGDIIRRDPERMFHLLPLAISLNATHNALRDRLMPINRKWPLEELKKSLLELPQSGVKDKLYLEYILIPGVNDKEEDARGLARFMEGIKAKVNLIPLNAPEGSEFSSASQKDLDRFRERLMERKIACFCRKRKGEDILASCGQLAANSTREAF